MQLVLGERAFDLAERCLVMGILNRTPDSFFDRGRYWSFDDFLSRAEQLVAEGADILDVGGVKAAPGEVVTETEEMERTVPAVEALRARFDVPLSIDTWRASVAGAAFSAGAIVGNDISGFADPDFLPVAAGAGASVVCTHVRLGPRIPDPDPVYDDVVDDVCRFLAARAQRAVDAGLSPSRIMVDAGLDLGKTWQQSLRLLRRSDGLAALGYPTFLSASNKTFLGGLVRREVGDRREVTVAAHALGVLGGCRILRAHDVAGTRRAADTIDAIVTRRAGR